jgi:hypothetical protein
MKVPGAIVDRVAEPERDGRLRRSSSAAVVNMASNLHRLMLR